MVQDLNLTQRWTKDKQKYHKYEIPMHRNVYIYYLYNIRVYVINVGFLFEFI
jgi:hypothetical protein